MTDGFSLPASAAACLADFDAREDVFNEFDVHGALQNILKGLSELSPEEKGACYAETLAFNLHKGAHDSPWKSHYGPMMTGIYEDGTPFYSPDIAHAKEGTPLYWQARANTVRNPILKARYADIAWDLSPAMGERRDPAMARLAVESYLAAVDVLGGLPDQLRAVGRALDLATAIRDKDLVEASRARLISLHREAVKTRQMWWFAPERLLDNKNAGLTDEQRRVLVDDLEGLLAYFSDHDPGRFNPHDVQSIAKRLIRIYTRDKKPDEIKRLHAAVGKAFEHFGRIGDGLLGSMVLDTAVTAFKAAGMDAEASSARLLLEQKVAQAREEMVAFETTIEIPKEKMDEYLAQIVVDSPGQTLANIAMDHLAKRKHLEELIASAAETAPIMAAMGRSILADTHVAAKVGSVEEDPLGRLLQQALMHFQLSNIWLNRALFTAIERHELVPEHFAAFASRAGLFASPTLLLEGLNAWFAADYVKAIHVLVPQVEHGLRQIVAQLGKPVTKPHKPVAGVSVAKNMGDILFDKEVTDALGPDLTIHLQALYTDPRGWNVRNELAHGLLEVQEMNQGMAQWVVHTLLLLGLWKEFSVSRCHIDVAEQRV